MYEDMSDFEVNKRLARLSGETVCDAQPASMRIKLSDVLVKTGNRTRAVDYCNRWADIGPLIERYIDRPNLINEMQFAKLSGRPVLRAAAICILKKLEGGK